MFLAVQCTQIDFRIKMRKTTLVEVIEERTASTRILFYGVECLVTPAIPCIHTNTHAQARALIDTQKHSHTHTQPPFEFGAQWFQRAVPRQRQLMTLKM